MIKILLPFLLIFTTTGFAEMSVLAFAGSTRQDSCNKKLIAEAARFAEETGARVTVIDLKNFPMPFYDGDLEKEDGMPENAKRLRKLMMESQVILISSPEYNHSMSAVLKNALDWASRNEVGMPSRDAFEGKRFALLSASPGKKGGAKGLIHLHEVLKDMRADIFNEEFSLPFSYEAFNQQGMLKNAEVELSLKKFVQKALK